jgi:FkbM family methyltransferase
MLNLFAKKLQKLLGFFGIYLNRKPQKFYYELEDEIKNNLIRASSGILHIGAHYGQESKFYFDLKKPVIWVEALPQVYAKLIKNIQKYENQIAICAMLGDAKKENQEINLSNNDFSASSLFKIHPESGFLNVRYSNTIKLPMDTLDNILKDFNLASYDLWVLDVQGAELLVLNGAKESLKFCKYLIVEASTRNVYIGGAQYAELKIHLEKFGFFPIWEPLENDHTDIPFIRKN